MVDRDENESDSNDFTARGDAASSVELNNENGRSERQSGENGGDIDEGGPARVRGDSENSDADWQDVIDDEDDLDGTNRGDDDVASDAASRTDVCDKEREQKEFPWGCEHYRRRCKIVAPCCGEVFWCRHCHDEVKMQQEIAMKKMHQLDRFAIEQIVCVECGEQQPPSAVCRVEECGIKFADYYCCICRFWDNSGFKKGTYHCDQCGICRVGGNENFFHCETCNACYSKQLKESHKCIEAAMKNDCPICLEDMFGSVKECQVLQCGHPIHRECLRSLERYRGLACLRCPTCAKTIHNDDRMTAEIDGWIAAQPMPVEHRFDVNALCNDCEIRFSVPFHFLGLKCPKCGFYNTLRLDK